MVTNIIHSSTLPSFIDPSSNMLGLYRCIRTGSPRNGTSRGSSWGTCVERTATPAFYIVSLHALHSVQCPQQRVLT